MKGFFRFLMIFYVIFRVIDCSDGERKKAKDTEWEGRYKSRTVTQDKPIGAIRPRSNIVVGSGVLESDSLERMYDRNYMDYNYHEYNMHDDDEWHGYFND